MKKQMSGLGCFALLLVVIIWLPVCILFHGFALVKLWGWFLIPLGLPVIGIAHACGISAIVALFKYHKQNEGQTENEDGPWENLLKGIIQSIIIPAFAIGYGYIIHLFM